MRLKLERSIKKSSRVDELNAATTKHKFDLFETRQKVREIDQNEIVKHIESKTEAIKLAEEY